MEESIYTVCIIMATFNGEKFIAEQLDSVLAQTYTNWQLFIRDDNSFDKTVDIIQKYVVLDKRIKLLNIDSVNRGSCQNFSMLLLEVAHRYPYYMYCDQDDVWLPFKIESTLSCLLQLKTECRDDQPLLVYTNFTYVNDRLNVIKSKKNFSATKIGQLCFSHLVIQNPAYGCTMMFNNILAQKIGKIPSQAENHDCWTALVAAGLGKIFYLNEPTILYRQHGNNISTNYDSNSFIKRVKRILMERKTFKDVQGKFLMAKAFQSNYDSQLSIINRSILRDFIRLEKEKHLTIVCRNLKNGVVRQTKSQTFLFYLSLLLKVN